MKKYLWIVVVVGLIIAGYILKSNRSGYVSEDLVSPTPTTAPKANSPVKNTQTGTAQISYEKALADYAGRVIQFDIGCQAIPNQIAIKSGSSLMFDNRSGDARWFAINGTAYYLKGYGFTILPIIAKDLPTTLNIDCGSAKNVGRILVQQ